MVHTNHFSSGGETMVNRSELLTPVRAATSRDQRTTGAACICAIITTLSVASSARLVLAGPIFIGLNQYGDVRVDPIISADGSTVVASVMEGGRLQAARWQPGAQFRTLGPIPGGTQSFPHAVSADGGVIVGRINNPQTAAFRWSAADGMQQLPSLVPGQLSQPNAVSADGRIIAGSSEYQVGRRTTGDRGPIYEPHAVMWDSAGAITLLQPAMQLLPGASRLANSSVYAMSADASRVAGHLHAFGIPQVVQWYGESQDPNLMTTENGFPLWGEIGMTLNGRVLYGGTVADSGQAARWSETDGLQVLGHLSGTDPSLGVNSFARAANADGSVIGGLALGTGPGGFIQGAMIWDEANGMRLLRDVLIAEYGLASTLNGSPLDPFDNWGLTIVTGMSADGLVMVGFGSHRSGPGGDAYWFVDLRPDLKNAAFELGDLNGWSVQGPGTAAAVLDPLDATNFVAELTTGSPVSILQSLDTPGGPFSLDYDYWFQTATGTLNVYLNSVLIDTLTAPSVLDGGFTNRSLLITDPTLWGLSRTSLLFDFDGPSGSQILLDNISMDASSMSTIPEPSSLLLALLGAPALMACRRGRRQQRTTDWPGFDERNLERGVRTAAEAPSAGSSREMYRPPFRRSVVTPPRAPPCSGTCCGRPDRTGRPC